MASSLEPSSAQLISRVYGFDGQGGTTLQQAGDEFALSRQRVHQICLQVEALRPAERLFLPTLERCSQVISLNSIETDAAQERQLQQRRLTARPFRIAGIRRATELLLAGSSTTPPGAAFCDSNVTDGQRVILSLERPRRRGGGEMHLGSAP